MAIINLRSPKYISYTNASQSSVRFSLKVWTGLESNPPSEFIYVLNKKAINIGDKVTIEVSELIRDYIVTNFNGYSTSPVWVSFLTQALNSTGTVITGSAFTNLCLDSYSYFEEPSFNIQNKTILFSNRVIYALADNLFRLPIHSYNNPSLVFFKDGKVIDQRSYTRNNSSGQQVYYVSLGGIGNIQTDTFAERVVFDGGTFENNNCLRAFFDEFEVSAVDKIQIADDYGVYFIDVKTLEECKYEPKKVTFINKFGVLQDMYFFKKLVKKMTVKKESYKANIISNGTYSISDHVKRDFNVVGNESISLSSGFLTEDYNEVFKQLMLSEKVWLTNVTEGFEQVLPINVKTSNITYKTSLNDKLVEYTIDFDNSYDTINNIR